MSGFPYIGFKLVTVAIEQLSRALHFAFLSLHLFNESYGMALQLQTTDAKKGKKNKI